MRLEPDADPLETDPESDPADPRADAGGLDRLVARPADDDPAGRGRA